MLHDNGELQLFTHTPNGWVNQMKTLEPDNNISFVKARSMVFMDNEILIAAQCSRSGRGLVMSYMDENNSMDENNGGVNVAAIATPIVILTLIGGGVIVGTAVEYKWRLLTTLYELIRFVW